ncbi:DNA adenine methylase [Chromobacterium haemolyticum]|uniref:DNA adenine methylase n=1 Tax=Chromobacterium haemolyticum TaxID=394935 RepID=UPI0024486B9F|nr:DNA adenine methylase [Chromobacterium haemolyticum]MDH0342085.1 DNA adenine methylase [Chromobacterium haemolyticum]
MGNQAEQIRLHPGTDSTLDEVGGARQVLKYPGSKAALRGEIIRHFPDHTTYVEAFGGGASVLLFKTPSAVEYYNDLDGMLADFFRILREGGDELERLIHYVEFTPYSRNELSKARKTLKGACNDKVEYLRAMLVCAWMSRMAMIHDSTTGWLSHKADPKDVMRWNQLPDRLREAASRLKRVYIESRPAIQVMKSLDGQETLFYLDPPYPKATLNARNKIDNYYRFNMSDDDHRELLAVAKTLKGKVIISGYRCRLYDQLLKSWYRVELAHSTTAGTKKTECLWMNFAPRSQLALSLGIDE